MKPRAMASLDTAVGHASLVREHPNRSDATLLLPILRDDFSAPTLKRQEGASALLLHQSGKTIWRQRLHPTSCNRLPTCRSPAECRRLPRTKSRTSSQSKRRAIAYSVSPLRTV